MSHDSDAGLARAALGCVFLCLVGCGGSGSDPAAAGEAAPPAGSVAPPVSPPPPASNTTRTHTVDLVRGGDFARPVFAPAQAELGTGVAWWRSGGGQAITRQVEDPASDGRILQLAPGASVEQVLVASPEALARGVLELRFLGPLQLVLTDANGGRIERFVQGPVARLELAALTGGAPDAVRPPVRLTLTASPGEVCSLDSIALRVPLPLPTRDELRAEIVERIDWTIETLLEHRTDKHGERHSSLLTTDIDVVTGEVLGTQFGWVSAFSELLLRAWRHAPRDAWEALLVRHVEELLELCLHPDTGLPVYWDPVADRQLATTPVEIARAFEFLLDCAEFGPPAIRERARAAALRIGESVLEHGVLSNGQILVKYVPATAVGTSKLPRIRALDVAGRLARLGALVDDRRFVRAAEAALDDFEYLHRWAGHWYEIDPGFDDDFGNWGGRIATMLEADPSLPAAQRLLGTGVDHYLEHWEPALLHGALIAADQVRGWEVLIRAAALDPDLRPRLDQRLDAAVHAHLVGQFSQQGIWVDLSHQLWQPRGALEVGDVPGIPGNLLTGLGLCAEADLGLSQEELRAWFQLVLRTTYGHYGRPYGCLPTPIESRAGNPSGAALRLALAQTEMLAALSAGD
ncbi:MAG: hypothetical protein AAFZ65_01450 [Planctomycetota bacterium]